MTQDQWDIYKLDRMYECLVRGNSQVPTIRNLSQPRLPSPKLTGKRRLASQSPTPPRAMPPPYPTTTKSVLLESESEGDDEDEVEYMIISAGPTLRPRTSAKRHSREQLMKGRQERRNKLHQKMQNFPQDDETHSDRYSNGITSSQRPQTPQTPERNTITPEPGKRKGDEDSPDVIYFTPLTIKISYKCA